jgi:hypothetical protein
MAAVFRSVLPAMGRNAPSRASKHTPHYRYLLFSTSLKVEVPSKILDEHELIMIVNLSYGLVIV